MRDMASSVHFREALPPEKWSRMAHFLALLRISSRNQPNDCAQFIEEWRKQQLGQIKPGRDEGGQAV